MTEQPFQVRFWGVRGSIPCPGPETVRYGGNTPCVEMRVADQHLIFDAGTGLRALGQHLLNQLPVEAHLFFTHSHWDHIQGFPFFTPAFLPGNCFHIYAPLAANGTTIEQRLNDQMLHPNFPVPLQVMGAGLVFHTLDLQETVHLGEVRITNRPLHHPGGAVGYRVEWGGHRAAYISDTEHIYDGVDPQVLTLAQNTDLMIYDSTYTDEEYNSPTLNRRGWGHSTWQEAVKVAQAAKVKTLVIFHHDPLHNDEFMDQVATAAQARFPNTIVAQEGMTIDLLTRQQTR